MFCLQVRVGKWGGGGGVGGEVEGGLVERGDGTQWLMWLSHGLGVKDRTVIAVIEWLVRWERSQIAVSVVGVEVGRITQ